MKTRLDVAVFENGIADSREKARALILEGKIKVNGQIVDKCGYQIKDTDSITLSGNALKYVSRGGLKLEKAIEVYNLDANNKICLDIGASTGGFTDCLLQNGASKVYSIDVGYNQLAYSLQTDPRVISIERTNFRYFDTQLLNKDKIDIIVCDVAFISLLKISDKITEIADDDTEIVLLIKPQFEANKKDVSDKGVIKDIESHKRIVNNVVNGLNLQHIYLKKFDYSPIKGPKGNIEFIGLFSVDKSFKDDVTEEQINYVIQCAHKELDK